METRTGKIKEINQKQAKNGNTFWIFVLEQEDGDKKYSTFDRKLGTGFAIGDQVSVIGSVNDKGYFDVQNIQKAADPNNQQLPAQQTAAPQKTQQTGSDDLQRQILAELKGLNSEMSTLRSILLHVQAISESLKSENGN